MTLSEGIRVTKVSYTIGDTTKELSTAELSSADGTQTYKIPGGEIVGSVSITIESNVTYKVTITAVGHGAVTPMSKVYNTGDPILESDFAVTPEAGYTYSWSEVPSGTATDNKAYTVTFTDATYNVNLPEGATSSAGNTATHGTDYTFTPGAGSDSVVTGVTAKIGDTPVTVTKNADGTYTISGNDIVGDITFEYDTVSGTWEFISFNDYKALKTGSETQVAIFKAAKAGGYALTGYGDMLYSEKYSGYVYIVADTETAATLSSKLAASENEVAEVDYSGDTNGSGGVTTADSATINDAIFQVETKYEIGVPARLAIDVTGDKTVTVSDITWVLNKAVNG